MSRRTLVYVAAATAVLLGVVLWVILAADGDHREGRPASLGPLSEDSTAVASIAETVPALPAPGEELAEEQSPVNDIRSRAAAGSDAADDDTYPGGVAPDAPVPPPPPVVSRLTVDERKACYWELIEAEDRAVLEADARYPMDADPPQVDKYVALLIELMQEYEQAVCEAHGISTSEADSIIAEGIVNRWPMPPLPE